MRARSVSYRRPGQTPGTRSTNLANDGCGTRAGSSVFGLHVDRLASGCILDQIIAVIGMKTIHVCLLVDFGLNHVVQGNFHVQGDAATEKRFSLGGADVCSGVLGVGNEEVTGGTHTSGKVVPGRPVQYANGSDESRRTFPLLYSFSPNKQRDV